MFGATIKSHVHAGAQKFVPGRDDPTWPAYGVSISDPRVGCDNKGAAHVERRGSPAVRAGGAPRCAACPRVTQRHIRALQ
jgi:3-deoxy-7-phosphoheptulonate synthase